MQLAVGTNSEFVHQDDGAEVIKQLKEKFVSTKSRSERIRILTVLPRSWSMSIRHIMDNFDCTFYQARLAKNIVEDKGVMSSPNARASKSLSEDTVKLVQAFYYHDDISRVMPGKKDFV